MGLEEDLARGFGYIVGLCRVGLEVLEVAEVPEVYGQFGGFWR